MTWLTGWVAGQTKLYSRDYPGAVQELRKLEVVLSSPSIQGNISSILMAQRLEASIQGKFLHGKASLHGKFL